MVAAGVLRHRAAEHHLRGVHVEPLPRQAHPQLLQVPRPLLLGILPPRPLRHREELPAGGARLHRPLAPVLAAVRGAGRLLPRQPEVRGGGGEAAEGALRGARPAQPDRARVGALPHTQRPPRVLSVPGGGDRGPAAQQDTHLAPRGREGHTHRHVLLLQLVRRQAGRSRRSGPAPGPEPDLQLFRRHQVPLRVLLHEQPGGEQHDGGVLAGRHDLPGRPDARDHEFFRRDGGEADRLDHVHLRHRVGHHGAPALRRLRRSRHDW